MPLSHDQKPRMKHRRVKGQRPQGSARNVRRRLRRDAYRAYSRLAADMAWNAERARRRIETEIVKHGFCWRDVEIAAAEQTGGRFAALDTLVLSTRDDRRMAACLN